jgi:hypothetical protein
MKDEYVYPVFYGIRHIDSRPLCEHPLRMAERHATVLTYGRGLLYSAVILAGLWVLFVYLIPRSN